MKLKLFGLSITISREEKERLRQVKLNNQQLVTLVDALAQKNFPLATIRQGRMAAYRSIFPANLIDAFEWVTKNMEAE